MMREPRWRGTPYSRPHQAHQWGERGGGHGGYGGYGAGGYGGRFGGGYDRGGRGRPRGMMRGGGGGYNSFADDGGNGGGYQPYSGGGYDYPPPQPPGGDYGGYSSGYGGGGDQGHMVAYPPIRSSQGGRGEGMGGRASHAIKMRGLPFSAKEEDVINFFAPHVPARVIVEYDQYDRPSGNAEVMFNTHEEAEKAMEKHNGHMGKGVHCTALRN